MAQSAPEPDWLDNAINASSAFAERWIAWTLDQLDKIGTAIINFADHHWLLLSIAVSLWLFGRRFLEWQSIFYLVTKHTLRKRIEKAYGEYKETQARVTEQRERAWLSRADEYEFLAKIGELEVRIKRHEEIRDILHHRLREIGGGGNGFRTGALKHKLEADRLRIRISHLKELWANRRVLNLVERLVHGDDADAKNALMQLNAIWKSIDCRLFVPYDTLSATDQKRIVHLFGMMVSNAHLGEARNAFAMMQKILDGYRTSWGEAA